jgi:hypothetical protein
MFNLFKKKPSEEQIAAMKKQLIRIAVGMLVQFKSLAEIQDFLVQYVAASDFPVEGSAAVVNNVVENFAQLLQSAGVQPDNLRTGPEPTTAVEKVINGSTYVDVTAKTHVIKAEKPLWKMTPAERRAAAAKK